MSMLWALLWLFNLKDAMVLHFYSYPTLNLHGDNANTHIHFVFPQKNPY